MTAHLWKYGTQSEIRAHIVNQDSRFQSAMRAELVEIAADRGLRLITPPQPKPPSKPIEGPRDVITIARTVPSAVPMTDAQRIILEICAKHKVTKAELIGRQRSTPIVAARREAAYRMKKETTLSLPQIGRKLGRDHSTIIHNIRRHTEALAEDGRQ